MSKVHKGAGVLLTDLQKRQYLELIDSFSKARILVIGDFILDRFIWGTVERISPEAPVPVVHVKNESVMPGGSLNVANNIHTLGGRVFPCGILGRDLEAKTLCGVLRNRKIDLSGVIYDVDRPTSVKTRVIAHSQQVVRVDKEKTDPIKPEIAKAILRYVQKRIPHIDVVILEDYGKGMIGEALLKAIILAAKKAGKPILVDPKEKNFPYYAGVTTLTPNRKEALGGADILRLDHENDVRKAGHAIMRKLKTESILITLGEHGMALFEKKGSIFEIPTTAREVFDVSGAGDTVISVLSLALARGAKMRDAAVLANLAAGIVVGKLGTATVSPRELSQAVQSAS